MTFGWGGRTHTYTTWGVIFSFKGGIMLESEIGGYIYKETVHDDINDVYVEICDDLENKEQGYSQVYLLKP
jgi:hypothetical protein